MAVFRTTVTGDFGRVDWEVADVREALGTYLWGGLRYDVLDETDLAAADLSKYAILILPSVRWGNEAQVTAALSQNALNNIRAFAQNGGFLYAQSNGAVVAQAAGVIPAGTVDLSATLVLTTGAEFNAGQLAVLNPASPLTFSWLTGSLYLLTDPVYQPGSLEVVAEYSNLDGPNQPAILTGAVGKGRVILVNGHPTAPTRRPQLPVFFNAILWALGHPAELFGDAAQTYNPALDPHLLPAYEPSAPVSVILTFANVWDTPMENVVITEIVTEGFTVDPASLNPAATVIPQTNPTQTLVVWDLGTVAPGEFKLNFIARTNDMVLRKGEITFATGQAEFTHQGKAHIVTHQPFRLTSRMAARLQLDRDIELDRQYYIPAQGLYLDVAAPIENKEDTLASALVFTDVVLLIAPIVGLDDQETILDLNSGETIWVRNEPFFYNEPGSPYFAANGYAPGDTITLADWDGAYAVFDVPYGTHLCGLSSGGEIGTTGTGNCVTIPVTYTNYITITSDYKLLLPVKVLTWDMGSWPGYHYEEPALRYGIHSRELEGRTVTFDGDPGIAPEQVVIQGSGGSIYTHLGDFPIFYRDHVASGLVYVPQAPTPPMISYRDIWSRTHTATLRSAFYDVFSWASCGSCGPGTGERHAMLNVTFGLRADLDGDHHRDEEILIYPSQIDGANLDIMIKDKTLLAAIPANQMVIDLGMFKGLGVDIRPRFGNWPNSWSSPNASVQLVDIETPSPAYDHLLFQHEAPAGETVVIMLHAAINSYDDVVTEGTCKLHDGARFTYRQQSAGPSRYEAYDTHVQGVLCEAPQLTVVKQGAPIQVSTYGDTVYYVFAIDDLSDPRLLERNGRGDPFLQSYGFGDTAATTYVGGREEKQILHSIVQPGDLTRIRVELNNNSPVAWSNVTVTPQPPAGIRVTRTYTDYLPPPIFHDIPFLYLQNIPEAGRGVYYFDVYIEPGYSGPRGQIVEIPIAFSANGAPAGFKIPAARLGLEDAGGQVYHVYGPAQTLVLTDSLPAYVSLNAAVVVTEAQITALTDAADPAGREAVFNSFSEIIGYTVDETGEASFDLPGDALDRLYTPTGDHRLFVAARGVISPAGAGPHWANYGAQVTYNDEEGLTWRDTSQQYEVEAHGAAIRVNYACSQAIAGVRPGLGLAALAADPSTCVLDAGEDHQVTLQATIYNDGDYPAQNVEATLVLPAGMDLLGITPAATAVASRTVTVNIGDLAPGGLTTVEMVLFVPVSEAGVIGAGSLPHHAQVIGHSDGQFVDTFSGRTIAARLGDDYHIPVRYKLNFVYLPLIFKNPVPALPQPDLVVTEFTVSPPAPVSGQPAQVTVVVENQGQKAAAAPFWVDFYISPNLVPAQPNVLWNDICGVSPCDGLAWQVNSLAAGETITLTSAAGYDPYRTQWEGGFRVSGAHDLYIFVDSWSSPNTPDGAVTETNEDNNRAAIEGIYIAD
ncbi:MAG: hypothetical protein JW953_00215 [Anaerolineae bacterium]|nr:hypothetical protein [Anaerolineae bacterium]